MLHENKRTYFFPDKDDPEFLHEVEITFVKEVKVSKSGGHRLTCHGGRMVYVPTGWLAIEIESDSGWEQ